MNKVYCKDVYVKKSTLSSKDNIFDGAFANKKFKTGDLIEKGIVRILPDSFDGNECPYVFTWSNNIPNKKWAIASGCSTFYNTCLKEHANVQMIRNFSNNTFKIVAIKDIEKNEELFHTYKSLKWRTCFKQILESIQ